MVTWVARISRLRTGYPTIAVATLATMKRVSSAAAVAMPSDRRQGSQSVDRERHFASTSEITVGPVAPRAPALERVWD